MRWSLILLTILLGLACAARTTPIALTPDPPEPTVSPDVWIEVDEAGIERVCLRLFEVDSLYRKRCVPLRDLQKLFDKMTGA